MFVRTVLPLAAAWFVIAPWLGAFRRTVIGSPRAVVWRLLVAWLIAGSVGLLVRSWLFDRPPIVSFAAVVLLGQGLILVGWRMLYAAVARAHGERALAE